MINNQITIEIDMEEYKFLNEKGHIKLEKTFLTTGNIATLICRNQKPVTVFCWMCYNVNNHLSSNLKKISRTICSGCGSENVSCNTDVNPNAFDFKKFTESNYLNGYCAACRKQKILTRPENVIREIDQKFEMLNDTSQSLSGYAICDVINRNGELIENQKFGVKIHNDAITSSECFWVCEDKDDLKILCYPNTYQFVIVGCTRFI